MKREAELKSAFFRLLKAERPTFYVLRYASRAAPDWTILGGGRQTNWEFKNATPRFESPGDQVLMCMRLAVAGHCRYVLWEESSTGTNKRTLIVHPRSVHRFFHTGEALVPDASCEGFDHAWLVDHVKQAHYIGAS